MSSGVDTASLAFVAAPLIIFGFLFCFFGYIIFRILLAITGFILGGAIAVTALSASGDGEVIILLGGFLFGGIIGAALLYILYFLGVFLVGAGFGALAASILLALAGVDSDTALVFILTAAGAGGVIALILEKIIVILGTSLNGASSIVTGIAVLIGDWDIDWEYTLETGNSPRIWSGEEQVMFIFGTFALWIVGAVFQFWFTARRTRRGMMPTPYHGAAVPYPYMGTPQMPYGAPQGYAQPMYPAPMQQPQQPQYPQQAQHPQYQSPPPQQYLYQAPPQPYAHQAAPQPNYPSAPFLDPLSSQAAPLPKPASPPQGMMPSTAAPQATPPQGVPQYPANPSPVGGAPYHPATPPPPAAPSPAGPPPIAGAPYHPATPPPPAAPSPASPSPIAGAPYRPATPPPAGPPPIAGTPYHPATPPTPPSSPPPPMVDEGRTMIDAPAGSRPRSDEPLPWASPSPKVPPPPHSPKTSNPWDQPPSSKPSPPDLNLTEYYDPKDDEQ